MLFDLIDPRKLRRALIYALLLLVSLLLQNEFFSHITILGARAMFLPAVVAGVALFEDGVWGALFGLAAGYFLDMAFADTLVTFTILLPLMGFGMGVLGKYLLQKGFWSYFFLSVTALALGALAQMFPFLFSGSEILGTVLLTGLKQVVWSLPAAVLAYFPCRSIAAWDRYR